MNNMPERGWDWLHGSIKHAEALFAGPGAAIAELTRSFDRFMVRLYRTLILCFVVFGVCAGMAMAGY